MHELGDLVVSYDFVIFLAAFNALNDPEMNVSVGMVINQFTLNERDSYNVRWPSASRQLVFPYPQGDTYAYLCEELVPINDEKRIAWTLSRSPLSQFDDDESLARVVIAVEHLASRRQVQVY